LLLTTFLLVKL